MTEQTLGETSIVLGLESVASFSLKDSLKDLLEVVLSTIENKKVFFAQMIATNDYPKSFVSSNGLRSPKSVLHSLVSNCHACASTSFG